MIFFTSFLHHSNLFSITILTKRLIKGGDISTFNKNRSLVWLTVLALMLAACGGGTADEPAEAPAPAAEEAAPATTAAAPEAPASVTRTADLPWGTFTLSETIGQKLANGDELNFILSIEGTAIAIFGDAMDSGWKRGMAEADARYDGSIAGRVVGPPNTDIPAQVAEIDALLDAGEIDCLAFEAHEGGPYIDVINKAMDQGIPVFGVNADSSDSKRISFHALDEFSAGKLAGKITGEWAIANGKDWKTAALMTGSVEGGWAQGRMTGFVEGLNAALPGLEWANTSTENIESQGWDPATSYAMVEAWVLGHPDVDIIFHTDQGVTNVAKAISDNGLSGTMYTSGFNIDPATADYIRSGDIIVTMVQGFSNQAARGAQACSDFLFDGNYDVGHVIMDPVAVTGDNVDSVDWTDPKNL